MSLAELIRGAPLPRVATATHATLATHRAKSVATVAKVATVAVANLSTAATIRDRLLALAATESRNPALVRALSESFMGGLIEAENTGDAGLRALLSMLADDADREAGRVPKGDTAAVLCCSCGPVWVRPSIAAVLPAVNGWPRALGCPWCFVRLPEGQRIPSPGVTCAECQHFPPAINPAQGCYARLCSVKCSETEIGR